MLEYEWKYSQKLGYFTSILQNRSLIVSLTKDRFEKSVWTVRWYKKTPCSDDDTNLLTVGCSFLCLPCEFGHRPTSLLYSLCMILIHVKNINTNNIEHSIADCPWVCEKRKRKNVEQCLMSRCKLHRMGTGTNKWHLNNYYLPSR